MLVIITFLAWSEGGDSFGGIFTAKDAKGTKGTEKIKIFSHRFHRLTQFWLHGAIL